MLDICLTIEMFCVMIHKKSRLDFTSVAGFSIITLTCGSGSLLKKKYEKKSEKIRGEKEN